MGVKFSQLPTATEVASDDYLAVLDSSESVLKKTAIDHASTDATYGLGTTSNYGHTKVIDDVTHSVANNGEALAAHQGNALAKDMGVLEVSDTATVAHASGDQFMWKSQYVKAKTAIAIGDTLSTSTNVTATNIGAEIVAASSSGTSAFIGTTAEVTAAISAGQITDGMEVIITDD